ncbi:hypothetical protein [Pseudomonas sp. stari2]|uniref:hypothetical protein n=1 Tax=Pseudomonas sp. Stari2 TaxID=2954814 RepID=UPI00345CDF88
MTINFTTENPNSEEHPIERLPDTSAYAAFLEQKVSIARKSMASGIGLSNLEIEAKFSSLRAMTAKG